MTLTTRSDLATNLLIEEERLTFPDFLVAGWVLRLRNTGERDIPILSRIYPVDMRFIAAFRRPEPPYPTVELTVRGPDTAATYRLARKLDGRTWTAKGAYLQLAFSLSLPDTPNVSIIAYQQDTQE